MKTLKEYIAESESWMQTPADGDVFAFEFEDNTLVETYIIEVADDCILLDATPEIMAVLEQWAALEDTDEGDSNVILETMGYGGLVGEDDDDEQLNEFLPALAGMATRALASPFVRGAIVGSALSNDDDDNVEEGNIEDLEKNIASAAVKPIPMEEGEMKRAMHADAEHMSLEQFVDKYGDEEWIREFYNNIMGDLDEAKYQGREVQLNKKMPGDQAKFKVYVKDPATGNVKKVNFGHGGKTAKRLGQKTMRIRKSNPAARKSFRARHNCDNPGSKLKARYWSCKNW
jgi:hypothetical protein